MKAVDTQVTITVKTSMTVEDVREAFGDMAGLYFDEYEITAKRMKSVSKDDIEAVYKAYPSKCVVSGRTTGKSSKDKDRIKNLLHGRTKDDLIHIIRLYVADCKAGDSYMKNFQTFLNNLPDYETEDEYMEEPTIDDVGMNYGGYRDFRNIEDLQ